jgi:serine/threonine-protein kinase ULK2
MNQIVQWTRDRFNEILGKTELVRLRLIDSQKRLPEDHPSHPNNISAETASSAGLGNSAEQVIVSSGITAEKLMYDRALEMSRSAAINELTGEDLLGCEISYITAIRMLEAVLDDDDDLSVREGSDEKQQKASEAPINGLWEEDRKTVTGCKFANAWTLQLILTLSVVTSIRGRLAALRKKLQVISRRSPAPSIPSPPQASPPAPHRSVKVASASPKS